MSIAITEETHDLVLSTGVAAGQTTQTPTAVDVNGCMQVLMRVLIGSIASGGVVVITPQYSTDGTNYTDMTDTITYADTDDNKLALVEFCRLGPNVKKVRVKIARTVADSAIISITAQIKNSRKIHPVGSTGASALDSTVKGVKRVSPNV